MKKPQIDYWTAIAASYFNVFPEQVTREQRAQVKELFWHVPYLLTGKQLMKALGITE